MLRGSSLPDVAGHRGARHGVPPHVNGAVHKALFHGPGTSESRGRPPRSAGVIVDPEHEGLTIAVSGGRVYVNGRAGGR